DFTISPEYGNTDTIFTFDASGCIDKEDATSQLQVHWDWENDGIWDTDFSTNKIIKYTFSTNITYTIVLEVKDTEGLLSSLTQELIVAEDTSKVVIDARDGNIYKTVNIGTQRWMAENMAWLPTVSYSETSLNFFPDYYVYGYEGTSVSAAKSSYAYEIYGVLYNWWAAKSACPSGWHLPSDEEWTILRDFLGDKAGGKMKEKGTTHWYSPNRSATNSSGFNALPGGLRYDQTVGFDSLGFYAHFWSSNQIEAYSASSWRLIWSSSGFHQGNRHIGHGYSVRCLKD
ncbi:FISUMP domain-containing protein, partial [Bacteroidota bacterium]